MSGDKHFERVVNTEHYVFRIHVLYRFNKGVYTSVHIYVGEEPHIPLHISLPFSHNDVYNISYENSVGNIIHIKKFREALLHPVSDEIWKKYSFSAEMLRYVMNSVIRIHFPYIKHLTLTDDSQLICSSNPLDKLDLLYYHVAVHKKTWYEQEFNAYFLSRDDFIRYKCNVESYANPKMKTSISWEQIETKIIANGTPLVYNFVKSNNDLCKRIYAESHNLPDFFSTFGKSFPYEEKCFAFKGWIEDFVREYIQDIPRSWIIDIYQARKGGFRTTRRIRRKQKA